MNTHIARSFLILLALASHLNANETVSLDSEIRSAIENAIPLIEAGSAGSAEERTCFTCHNQALPVLALTEVKRQGFTIDATNLERQLNHTLAHLARGKKKYVEGKGQGGRAVTAGYALLALEAGGYNPNDTTEAVVSYLLQHQKKSDHWSQPGNRPPTSGSDFTTTALAIRGLKTFGTKEQQPAIETRLATVRQWLANAEPKDTEDRVFHIAALVSAKSDDSLIQDAIAKLLETQREDGGWSQTDQLESDAYATGTALTVLLQTNPDSVSKAQREQAIQYLLDTQCEDGSWHVATRAKGFQEYFESGFPHEEDQFVSIAASCWATIALTLSLSDLEGD